MSLAPGTRIGPYEILSALGAGGMGEVYRARDAKLNRDVALKVLPEAFARDPDRLARFRREAQLLAALSHANIGGIFGLEESADVHALVLEFVDGPTLAEMLAGFRLQASGPGPVTPARAQSPEPGARPGALPFDEALPIARQIADALETAHLAGIIHRDLKPANIKVTPDGRVKVLDFGLAKLTESSAGVPGGAAGLNTMSPTLSAHATSAGVILGTASYMSPEQAKGRPVDKRTDVWAFGCVLYEMLTGARVFDGEDVTEAIAAVVRGVPDWSKLPRDVPAQIKRLLEGCLEKDRTQRISDISTARFVLAESTAPHTATPSGPLVPAGPPRRRTRTLVGATAVVAAVGTAAAAWVVLRPQATPPPETIRFAIEPSSADALAPTTIRRLAISPDGRRIVYVSREGRRLMVRSLDQIEAVPIRGVTNASWPFFSPDGEWIGFFDQGELKKVSVNGGPAVVICRAAGAPGGATWGVDHRIIFANDSGSGLFSVSDGGGDPTPLTKPSPTGVSPVFPSLLPDGRSVLLTMPSIRSQLDNAQIAVLNLQTGEQKAIVQNGSNAEYLPSGSGNPGYLIYATGGALRAVRFDTGRLEVIGSPIPLNEQVAKLPTGASEFALSQTGSLVYSPGGEGDPRTLVWVTRQGGAQTPLKAPPRTYQYPRISPDGRQVAVSLVDQEKDIWIWDVALESLRRLTIDPGIDQYPLWTPDSQRIVFSSTRTGGVLNAYWQRADGTGTVEQLFPSGPSAQVPMSIRGAVLLSVETSPKTDFDLTRFQLGAPGQAPRKPEMLLQTQYGDAQGEVSPDGRWLAYISNESGQYRVYVVPYPNVKDGRWEISAGAGVQPVWSGRGDEIFYASGGAIMAVPVRTGSTFSYGNPVKLFTWSLLPTPGRAWDVSSDGQRFLMIKEGQDQTPAAATIVVVANWTEELRRRFEGR